jgi:L-lactate dehydrogenase complex protein LldG
MPIETFSKQERIRKLQSFLEAVRSEVHVVPREGWTGKLREVLTDRGLETLLYAPGTSIGKQIEAAWAQDDSRLPKLCTYEGPIESFKTRLFEIDAAVTTSVGAIAETGAVVLWPDAKEPRLMSLVPPVHIAVVEADRIYNNFCEIIQQQHWAEQMPTNVVLISGPSRTADIEMTLAFGVHGPRALIVMILES